jgi:hypothetical protein
MKRRRGKGRSALPVRLEFGNGARINLTLSSVRVKQLARNPKRFRFKQDEIAQIVQKLSAIEVQHRGNVLAGALRELVELIEQQARSAFSMLGVELLTKIARRLRAFRSPLFHRSGVSIASPPGSWLLRVATHLVSRKTRERVAEPIVRDMRDEYYDALAKEERVLARSILVRGRLAFLWAVFVRNVLEGLIKIAFARR